MKKKSKIILGVCTVAAALIGMSVWNIWFSPTKIAFINFQTIQQGSISKANDNLSIKLSEVSLDNLDRLTGYDMVFINGMGLRIVEEQRQQIQQAADKGIPVYTSMATNPANNICNLDSVQQNLIGSKEAFHHCRFSGTVFTHQSHNGSRFDIHANMLQNLISTE